MAELTFEWDETKRRANIRKHGLDFADAQRLFAGMPLLVTPDTNGDYGEERWFGLGKIGTRIVVIVFVSTQPNVIRVISLRKADKDEEAEYYKNTLPH